MSAADTLALSGERFSVDYAITGDAAGARERARDICIEQTVEFPEELLPTGDIAERVVGRIESFESAGPQRHIARISYAIETSGFELTQLLNVMFGNFSLKPGVRIERLDLPAALLAHFRGPRFGVQGLRAAAGVMDRPLLCSALKPMGLSARELAQRAHDMALGGMGLIKDDHGLSNQPFAPFEERVARVCEAVAKANAITGERALYLPNITAAGDGALRNARRAKALGAGGLLISPMLTGFGAMQQIADDDGVALPIMAHPAFGGSFVTHPDNGISHMALYGQLARLAGADASVYPNWGGRFSFSKAECESIARGCSMPMGALRAIFPAPGGGITMERVRELNGVYGNDVVFLMGGGLFRHGPDLVQNCRYFRNLVG